MRSTLIRLIVLGGTMLLASSSLSASVDLSLEVYDAGRVKESSAPPGANGRVVHDIRRGQIVSVWVQLRNSDPKESAPVTPSLRPEAGAVEFMLITPDGEERALGRGRWQRHYYIAPRNLQPGEVIAFETWFFDDVFESAGATQPRARRQYIFDTPGEYHIYVRFITRPQQAPPPVDDSRHATVIESNQITIRVDGEIAGWEALKTAGILDAVGGGEMHGVEGKRKLDQLEPLIHASGDSGLIQWLDTKRRHLREQP